MSNVFQALFGLKGLVFSLPGSVDVINSTFRLHRFTSVIFIACSVLVSCKQFLGENIHCMLDGLEEEDDKKLIESYCFMKSTFTLSRTEAEESSHLHAHQGVGQNRNDDNEFHNYYQWVCFVLFLQAIFFYVPYMVWKSMEKGTIKKLLVKIPGIGEQADDAITEMPLDEQVSGLAKYLYINKDSFNGYAGKFLMCEFANLVNVLVQIYFMDVFLDGEFIAYGTSFFTDPVHMHHKNMESVFPKVTMCTMPNFGVSGKIVNHSGICTLPVNIISEKIYVFLFVWMIILAALSVLHCAMELAVIASRTLRNVNIGAQMFQIGSGCELNDPTVDRIIKYSSYGNFVILRQIAKNMEPTQFKAVLSVLGRYLEPNHNLNLPVPFPSPPNPNDTSKFTSTGKGNMIFRV